MRLKAFIVSLLLSGTVLPALGQIVMLPRERVDSLVSAHSGPDVWIADGFSADSLSIDAGKVYEDDSPIEVEFVLRNGSDSAVYVSRLETSCSCVTAQASSSLLKIGESIVIKARYRQAGHSGFHPRYIRVFAREGGEESILSVLCIKSYVLKR